MENNEKEIKKHSFLLIALCWLVYTCSYIGKLGYNANIIQIEDFFNVSHAEAGLVSTFFFFAYGAGQIINGICCKKYNLKYVISVGLILSGLSNVFIGVVSDFKVIKYLWILNGGALSVLWTGLVRLLSETLDEKYMSKAVVVMGTTVATGTFLVYGLSALFVALNVFKLVFFIAGILLPVIAVIWFIASPYIVGKIKSFDATSQTEESVTEDRECAPSSNRKTPKGFFVIFIVFAIYAVITNLVKDGLTSWVPIVLNETYRLPDYVSILLTLALPLCAIFGTYVVVAMHKKIKNFVSICAIMFAISCVLIGTVIRMLVMDAVIVTVISFALISCFMAGVNNVVTSMMPLYWKDKVNSGMVSGILNGFCYLGSMLSSYGLGMVADISGWQSVFWLLFSVCAVASVVGALEWIIGRLKGKNRTKT